MTPLSLSLHPFSMFLSRLRLSLAHAAIVPEMIYEDDFEQETEDERTEKYVVYHFNQYPSFSCAGFL